MDYSFSDPGTPTYWLPTSDRHFALSHSEVGKDHQRYIFKKAHPFFVEAVKPVTMMLRVFPSAGVLASNLEIFCLGVLE